MCRVFLVRGFFIVRGVVDDNGLRIVQKASRKEGSRFICGKHDEIPKFQVKTSPLKRNPSSSKLLTWDLKCDMLTPRLSRRYLNDYIFIYTPVKLT